MDKDEFDTIQRNSFFTYTDDETGAMCFFEEKYRKIFDGLKLFYTVNLNCSDIPSSNSPTNRTTAEQFASMLLDCLKKNPVLESKAEEINREKEIIKSTDKLIKQLNDRPSRYWMDHQIFNRKSREQVASPMLYLEAIKQGSEERISILNENKRKNLYQAIFNVWNYGGFPELNEIDLDPIKLATMMLYLTDQLPDLTDDKGMNKWNCPIENLNEYKASIDCIEYKDASKFLKAIKKKEKID